MRTGNFVLKGFLLFTLIATVVQAQPAESPWPMYKGNNCRTGVSSYTGPEFPTLKWCYDTGAEVYSSPVIGPDGTIYCGSNSGYLYALNSNGTLKWTFSTGEEYDVSSPAIDSQGKIYVGNEVGRVFAVGSDGQEKWGYNVANDDYTCPAIGVDGTIYVGSIDDHLRALTSDGSFKWKYNVEHDIHTSPAIDGNGNIYFGSVDGKVHSVNSTGQHNWSLDIGTEPGNCPAIGADGTIYITGHNNKVFAINSSGELQWTFQTAGYNYSSPSIGTDGTIYVSSIAQKMYAINPDGSLKWESSVSGTMYSSPLIDAGGRIYVGARDDMFYAFDSDGSLLWGFNTDDWVDSSPALDANGVLYFGCNDGHIYAVGNTTGKAPQIVTNTPDYVGDERAVLSGIVKLSGPLTTIIFEYGTTTAYGTQISPDDNVVIGTDSVRVSVDLTKLTRSTTYHYRIVAENRVGVSYGADSSFTTTGTKYPETVMLNHSLEFPQKDKPTDYIASDYRLLGLPGASNFGIDSFLSGDHRDDWQVYWDNGGTSDYFVEFDGSSNFNCIVGRAFWLLNRGTWSINSTVSTAALSQDDAVGIPLHNGWNLITNPFTTNVSWSVVQAANDITQPIWKFNGSFAITYLLSPYAGYYFDNTDTKLTTLKIPYPGSMSKQLKAELFPTAHWTAEIRLMRDQIEYDKLFIGTAPDAKTGKDGYDIRKPRAIGEIPAINFHRTQWDASYPNFAADIRAVADAYCWEFDVHNPTADVMQFSVRNIQSIPAQYFLFIIDQSNGNYVNMRITEEYPVYHTKHARSFKLLVTKSAGDDFKPVNQKFTVEQNYPNPFNPSTTIAYTISIPGKIRLDIYNLVGERIRTLYNGQVGYGRHTVSWDGRNAAGAVVPSGVYFYQISAPGGMKTSKKMLLMK